MLEVTENPQPSDLAIRAANAQTLSAQQHVSTPQHVDQLDGLRGLAIVMVMVFHMTTQQPIGKLAEAWCALVGSGALGVDVFFVLSGFLITNILLSAAHAPHYFRNFYARRALRILPLYYAVLTFAFVFLPRFAGARAAKYEAVNADAIWYWLHLSNFSIAKRGAFIHGFVDVSWSLAIEEQFYLLWPAIVWCVSPRRLRSLCVALVVVSVASRVVLGARHVEPVAIYTLTFCRFDGLAIGALVALMVRGRAPSAIGSLMVRGFWATCPLCLIYFAPLEGSFASLVKLGNIYLFAAALTGCVILAVLSTPKAWLIRPLDSRILKLFGRYSYALYLFHFAISGALREFILTSARMPLVFGSSLTSHVVFYLTAGAASLGDAVLSWHLYEKRFLRLKRLFV